MEVNNLASALAQAQSEMEPAEKSGYNPGWKSYYSTFEDLKKVSRKVFGNYGLSVIQFPDFADGITFLVTKLKHVSGEEEVSRTPINLEDPTDMQAFGSAVTYIKRNVYAAICGIAASEGDDDGNRLSKNESKNGNTPKSVNGTSEYVSIAQLSKLRIMIQNNAEVEKAICAKYGIESLEKLPWKRMNEVVAVLER